MRYGARLGVVGLASVFAGCLGDDGQTATAIKGQVLETVTQNPIAGVEVSIGDDEVGWKMATTDAAGWFTVRGISEDSTRVRLDGRAASTADKVYPKVTTRLHEEWIVPGELHVLQLAKYLPVTDVASGTDFQSHLVVSTDPEHPAEDGWLQLDPNGSMVEVRTDNVWVVNPSDPEGKKLQTFAYMQFPAGTYLKFPEGEPHQISITQLPVSELPHQLPDYIYPDVMLASQPGGTIIDPPVQLHFGREFVFDAEVDPNTVDIWSLSHEKALFLRVGDAEEVDTNEGTELRSLSGLAELGWHGPRFRPPAPRCMGTNFKAKVQIVQDGQVSCPADGVVFLAGRGSRSSTGCTVETGRIPRCNGNFRVEHQPPLDTPLPSKRIISPDVFARTGPAGGEVCLGTFTIDVSTGKALREDGC